MPERRIESLPQLVRTSWPANIRASKRVPLLIGASEWNGRVAPYAHALIRLRSDRVKAAPTLEQFLAGLRTAWKEGEVRPTARHKPKATRLRRRPDPFAAVDAQLRAWF